MSCFVWVVAAAYAFFVVVVVLFLCLFPADPADPDPLYCFITSRISSCALRLICFCVSFRLVIVDLYFVISFDQSRYSRLVMI